MGSPRVWIKAKIPGAELDKLTREFPAVRFLTDHEAEAALDGVDAVLAEEPLSDAMVQQMKSLKWVQVTRGGANAFLTPTVKTRPITVTSSKGVHGLRFSELAIACIFALAKRLPQCWEEQRDKRWGKVFPDEVSGKTLGIIGLGTIGSELARKAKALGMRVIATKRRATGTPPYVDELGTPDFLPALLSLADFVVISVASIPSTENIMGERELRAMKKNAFLINLTGGKAIREHLLVRALKEGWFAGAALDTVPNRSLAPDSELWGLPNVILSFGSGGFTARKWDDVLPIFVRNLRLFLEGKDLHNAIAKQLGY
ncbi:MAG: D-2-hydroxyacid dehydrogenase [Candidatus Binatia bacterium]